MKGLLNYHGLKCFFDNLNSFEDFAKKCGVDFELNPQVYSDLFYGTDFDVYIPLWASAIKSGKDVLLNEVTYDVIKFYKAHGYNPVFMDGNPADFVGEQLRFMESLCYTELKEEVDKDEFEKAKEEFLNSYLVDCLTKISREVSLALEQIDICEKDEKALGFVLDLISKLIKKDYYNWNLESLDEIESELTLLGDKLEVEEPHKVSIASNCDCGSKCKMLALTAEGCLLGIEPDTYGTSIPFHGCPRGQAYGETYLTSKRLRFPMKRIGMRGDGKFKRITWEEAVKEVSEVTRNTYEKYGPSSRFVINAAGVSAAIRGDRFMKNLLALSGGYLNYYNYYSAACTVIMNPYIYGTVLAGNHDSTYEHSKLIIMWGYNPATCHFGVETKDFFMRAKEAGAKIIVIDPRKSDTALSMADEWIPINPTSDAALVDAIAYTIWENNLQNQEFMDKFCLGFDSDHMPEGVPKDKNYKDYVFGLTDGIPKTPQWAAKITGIPEEKIKELAIEYATTKPAALLPGYAPQRTIIGEQACLGFAALALMTGNVGILGGSTGIPYLHQGHDCPGLNLFPNPYPGEIPVFHWTRAIEKPETIDNLKLGLKGVEKLDSGIKVIYSLASGIVMNQHSNTNDTIRILKTEGLLESLILSDLFMTPSARYSDIILPAVSFFENDNIPGTWADDDYVLYNHAITKPLFGCRFEYQWIREVAKEMGLLEEFDCGKKSQDEWLRYVYKECQKSEPELPDFDTFKEKSFHVFSDKKDMIAFEKNIKEGIPFDTPSGKIEIFSKALYEMGVNSGREREIPGRPGYVSSFEGPDDPLREKYPLQLIAYHTKKRCHSQNVGSASLEELDKDAIWINPIDAKARNIKDGDMVEAFNDRGVIKLPAFVTERIKEGVIAISEGGWLKKDKDGKDIGGSINVLTTAEYATPIANGNPQHTNLADVRLG